MTFTSNTEDYVDIKVSSIIFDENIADMIEKLEKPFPKCLNNNLLDMGTFELDDGKVKKVLEGYKKGLPPVKVKKTLGDKYILIDGRHRMSAVIVSGGDTIPCKIVDSKSIF